MEKEEKIDQDIYQKHLENDFLNQLERQKSIFHKVVEENARLKRRINQFEKELAKDEEVKTLKEQIARMHQESLNGFTISKRVSNKFEKFKESHLREKHWDYKHDCPMSAGAAGGRFSYTFVPTGIGTLITCTCACGEEITEMDD